jgi:hypothetical protein
VRTWDLSYENLTGVAARSYLRELKKTDPTFWDELTSNLEENIPPEDVPQPEDEDNDHDDGGVDDSDIPTHVVIQAMVQGSDKIKGKYSMHPEGGITMDAMAERFDDEEVKIDEDQNQQLGRGKHRKRANQQYTQFWRYNADDSSGSDAEDYCTK